MAKVLCVLYDDPVEGYPTTYARDSIPRIERYPSSKPSPSQKQLISSLESCLTSAPMAHFKDVGK
jgi:hypothetical protein